MVSFDTDMKTETTHTPSLFFYIMWNNLYLDCGSHGSSFVVHWLNPPLNLLLFWSFGVRLSWSFTSSSVGTWRRSSTFKRRADDLHCALAESSIQTSLIRMFDLCMNFMLHQSFPLWSSVWSLGDSVNSVHWLNPQYIVVCLSYDRRKRCRCLVDLWDETDIASVFLKKKT